MLEQLQGIIQLAYTALHGPFLPYCQPCFYNLLQIWPTLVRQLKQLPHGLGRLLCPHPPPPHLGYYYGVGVIFYDSNTTYCRNRVLTRIPYVRE